jgi:hypothetical protein
MQFFMQICIEPWNRKEGIDSLAENDKIPGLVCVRISCSPKIN